MKERNTVQKQRIYAALCALGHPTATEVYDYLRRAHPAVSRGTVFRVLNGFTRSGKAVRLHLNGSDERYDATLTPHFHARCRACGGVFDVFSPQAETLLKSVNTGEFATEGCFVEFFGLCGACKEAENPISE